MHEIFGLPVMNEIVLIRKAYATRGLPERHADCVGIFASRLAIARSDYKATAGEAVTAHIEAVASKLASAGATLTAVELPASRYLGFEIELNQRWIATAAQRRALAAVIAAHLP